MNNIVDKFIDTSNIIFTFGGMDGTEIKITENMLDELDLFGFDINKDKFEQLCSEGSLHDVIEGNAADLVDICLTAGEGAYSAHALHRAICNMSEEHVSEICKYIFDNVKESNSTNIGIGNRIVDTLTQKKQFIIRVNELLTEASNDIREKIIENNLMNQIEIRGSGKDEIRLNVSGSEIKVLAKDIFDALLKENTLPSQAREIDINEAIETVVIDKMKTFLDCIA